MGQVNYFNRIILENEPVPIIRFFITTFGWPMVILPAYYGKDCWGTGGAGLTNRRVIIGLFIISYGL